MARITFEQETLNTRGDLPAIGSQAPDFLLTRTDLTDVSLNDFKGQRIVLSIFPSIDTPVCARSMKRFNAEMSAYDNTAVLCVSRDLPFAHKRFCQSEGIDKVYAVSEMRNRDFGRTYGMEITSGPMAGVLARAVVVIDAGGTIVHTQLVADIAAEPDYESVGTALDAASDAPMDACTRPVDPESVRMDDMGEPCDDGRAG